MAWQAQQVSARVGNRVRRGIMTGLLVTQAGGRAIPAADDEQSSLPVYQALPACSQVPTHFGRMFSGHIAASWSSSDIDLLATKVMADRETDSTPEGQVDAQDIQNIDATYTYVGQFID